MGFFSSLKRLWSASPEVAEDAKKTTDPAFEGAQSAPATEICRPEAPASEEGAPDSEPEQVTAPGSAPGLFVAPPAPSLSPPPAATDSEDGFSRSTPPHEAVWRDTLVRSLREAEPRLSVWLEITLAGMDRAGEPLWERLRFLLTSLGAPEEEAEAFTAEFASWAEKMDYVYLEDFRSELQFRLALALDLEDEEDERNRLFLKLHAGLSRTRERFGQGLTALFASHGALDAAFWEELEELFIMADMGAEASRLLCARLKERAGTTRAETPEDLRPLLAEELRGIFRIPRRVVAVNPPEVVLLIGVNGVGKTTTIAKLAWRARMQGKKVLLAAGDTFRAAAVEQLGIWAERTGSAFHSGAPNADPASVAWEAVDRAVREEFDILFVDTAGRLHTKTNLMEELKKIRQVIAKKHPGAPHRTILILDATTGQNALSQTKLFDETAGIDEIILTKLDGTAKGGVAVAVAMQHKLPITFVGLGEKMEDLRPFDGDDFARALLGQERNA